MVRSSGAGGVAFILIFAATSTASAEDEVLAVAPISVDGLTPAAVDALADAVAAASDDLFAARVLGAADVRELARRAVPPFTETCTGVLCWARLGAAVEASHVLAVEGVRGDTGILLSAKWVVVSEQRILARIQHPIPADVLDFPARVAEALAELAGKLPDPLRKEGAPPAVGVAAAVEPAPPSPEAPPPEAAATAAPPPPALTDGDQGPTPPPPASPGPGWAGLKFRPVEDEARTRLGLSRAGGVLVTVVTPQGPAEGAGLRTDDVIRRCNGSEILIPEDFKRFIQEGKTGDTLTLKVERGAETLEVALVLAPRPRAEAPAGTDAAAVETTERREIHRQSTEVLTDSQGGIGVQHQEETVREVTTPVDSVWTGTYNLGAGLVLSDLVKSYLVSGGIGLRYLDPEGDFPGKEGGTRNAFAIIVTANGFFNKSSFDFESLAPGGLGSVNVDFPESQTLGHLEVTVAPAYAYFDFNSWEPETMEQKGWGLTLGLAVGFKVGKLPPDYEPETTMNGLIPSVSIKEVPKSFGFVIKPAIGVEFPRFNPGTAEFGSFMITGFIWPFPLSVNLAAGGTF